MYTLKSDREKAGTPAKYYAEPPPPPRLSEVAQHDMVWIQLMSQGILEKFTP